MNQTLSIASSILLGSALVAGALLFSSTGVAALSAERNKDARVFGNPDAPVTIVEFSDVECPFCSRLHPTLERVVAESEGSVKWEYRHLPLPMHRNAELGAAATECVAMQAGNDAFWEYLSELLQTQSGHSQALYEEIAQRYAIDIEEFRSCVVSDKVTEMIALDRQVAQSYGGSGTPFSVVVFEDGTTRAVSGALPYEQWKSIIAQP